MATQFSEYMKGIGLNENLLTISNEIGKRYFQQDDKKGSDHNLNLQLVEKYTPKYNEEMNEKLNSRSSNIHGTPIDTAVSKKLFKLWAYLLKQDLPDDFKELLDLFELPDKLETDTDCFRFITAVNIISSCTMSIRFIGIVQLFMNTGIVFGMKWIGKLFGDNFLSHDVIKKNEFKQLTDAKINKLSSVLHSAEQGKRRTFKFVAKNVRHYHDLFLTNGNVDIEYSHPYLSIMSDYLNDITNCVSEVIANSNIISSFLDNESSDVNIKRFKSS
jgi:hypothetical protein